MSRWFPALALTGVVLAGAGSVQAQESETLTATIPFDFKVGQATLPAGQYSLSYDAAESPGVLTVRGKDGHEGAVALTMPVASAHPTKDAKLVFAREGTITVLSEVFVGDDPTGLEVVGTRPVN